MILTDKYPQEAVGLLNEIPEPINFFNYLSVTHEGAIKLNDKNQKLDSQQLLAGMAFRLFGFDNMPIYYVDTSFMQRRETERSENTKELLQRFNENREIAKNGKVYKNNVTDYTADLTIVKEDANVLSFSKVIGTKEIMVAYNTSRSEACEKFILLNSLNDNYLKQQDCVFGYEPGSKVPLYYRMENTNNMCYIKVYLKPLQLVILKNY